MQGAALFTESDGRVYSVGAKCDKSSIEAAGREPLVAWGRHGETE